VDNSVFIRDSNDSSHSLQKRDIAITDTTPPFHLFSVFVFR
jgi:hypothetical protein